MKRGGLTNCAVLFGLLFSLGVHAQDKQAVIKLEDTIRGDQEQPKVLTIVPWQLPEVKEPLPSPILDRINKQFAPLERSEFKRQIDFLTQQKNRLSYSASSLEP